MRCPFCSHEETQVVETRDSDEGDVVRRRRRCHACDKRFTTYERAEIAMPSVVKNAVVLADTLTERGLRIVSGRTESHVMLVDLRPKGLTGKEAENLLGAAHMTCNKNGIPNDPQKPMVTSGIRLGTPAMTTRGFKEDQVRQTAHLIADMLDKPNDEATLVTVKEKVAALTQAFPVYGG